MNTNDALRQPPLQPMDPARLLSVLNNVQVGLVISKPGGHAEHWNEAAQQLLALDDLQMRGDSAPDPARTVVHEDGSEFSPDTQPLAVALATGRAVRNIVMGIFHPARHQRVWLLANATPQLDDRGGVARVITTYSDITERRGFEARLALSDRLNAMGTLAAGIAHEINNPLAYITANLSYADEELADPTALSNPSRLAEIRHAILEARDGADRVRDIVAEMRTFCRGDAPRGPVDVSRVLDSASGAIASEVRTRARLVKQLQKVPLVLADEARLAQVFINLILNAADAIPDGDPSRNEIALTTCVDAAGRAVVEVRDTGSGISPELQHRIFDPFFSSKPVGKGMGLGLAICHHIITELGGTISVESAPERGSLFRIILPAAEAASAPPPK